MIDVGRVCIKIAGRDSGKKCVVVEVIDDNFVLIDGETRRRKCNKVHLEPTAETVGIASGADHGAVAKALGIEARKTTPKKAAERPRKVRKNEPTAEKKPKASKQKEAKAVKKEEKPVKKAVPKEASKKE